jgi:hypothetical protein
MITELSRQGRKEKQKKHPFLGYGRRGENERLELLTQGMELN